MCTKFGTAVGVADVITSDNFFGHRLRGVDFVGVENRHLPLTKPVAVNSGDHRHSCHYDLGMKTVSACWVPRMLTDEQKQNRVDVCTDLLCRLQAQPQIFLNRIVTHDDSWVHHFHPVTKPQSMVWKRASSPTLKKLLCH